MAVQTNEFQGQQFALLKDHCMRHKRLFRDYRFPADEAIGRNVPNIVWVRASKLHPDPAFMIHGISRFNHGSQNPNHSWFVSAIAHLQSRPSLFERVIPPGQSMKHNYFGIFHFRFWQFGKWVDVVVDDFLPTLDGMPFRFLLPESMYQNEFWPSLLEKAYAKLYGSYSNIMEGTKSEALSDFCGGCIERYLTKQTNPDMMCKLLWNARDHSSLMSCVTKLNGETGSNGIYLITKLIDAQMIDEEVFLPFMMIRLRCLLGRTRQEWREPWPNHYEDWESIEESTRERIGLFTESDDDFWMSIKDFMHHFHAVDLCHIVPTHTDLHYVAANRKPWRYTSAVGAWMSRVSAGGSLTQNSATFLMNPQFRIILEDSDDYDQVCTCVISLIQRGGKNRKGLFKNGDYYKIGFYLLPIRPQELLPLQTLGAFQNNANMSCTNAFKDGEFPIREVVGRFYLAPGHYAIVPCTKNPDEQSEFLVRMFCEKRGSIIPD